MSTQTTIDSDELFIGGQWIKPQGAGRISVLAASTEEKERDTQTGADVADLLFALHARSRTTLFLVTHEEALAQRCSRIVRLKDGSIVADERQAPQFAKHS